LFRFFFENLICHVLGLKQEQFQFSKLKVIVNLRENMTRKVTDKTIENLVLVCSF
jgi:hypothetical protein